MSTREERPLLECADCDYTTRTPEFLASHLVSKHPERMKPVEGEYRLPTFTEREDQQ